MVEIVKGTRFGDFGKCCRCNKIWDFFQKLMHHLAERKLPPGHRLWPTKLWSMWQGHIGCRVGGATRMKSDHMVSYAIGSVG